MVMCCVRRMRGAVLRYCALECRVWCIAYLACVLCCDACVACLRTLRVCVVSYEYVAQKLVDNYQVHRSLIFFFPSFFISSSIKGYKPGCGWSNASHSSEHRLVSFSTTLQYTKHARRNTFSSFPFLFW